MALLKGITLGKVVIATFVALLILQFGSVVLNQLFGLRLLQLGNVIALAVVLPLVAIAGYRIVITNKGEIQKRDVLAILMIAGLAAASVYALYKFGQPLFSDGGIPDLGLAIQSIVG